VNRSGGLVRLEEAQGELGVYLRRWGLTPDSEAFCTHSSWLQPVLASGRPAILKVAAVEEERQGGAAMAWWAGEGAARVLAHEGSALLLERALGERCLVEMTRTDRDDEATRILCEAAARLHRPRGEPPPTLMSLEERFRSLVPAAAMHGGILGLSARMARKLLHDARDPVVLHGDLHHRNVLDFGERGWLAIDPKGLRGERAFDFANIFCNPDPETALLPGRLERQLEVVVETAGVDRRRMVGWILAYAGLSAVWSLEDGDDPDLALEVARLAHHFR
jgi:streptomycin 6-kinase